MEGEKYIAIVSVSPEQLAGLEANEEIEILNKARVRDALGATSMQATAFYAVSPRDKKR